MRVPVAPTSLSTFGGVSVLILALHRYVVELIVLICNSLVNDSEHIFKHLITTCTASLVRCVLRSLAHFFDWVVFLLLSFKSSLYILANSPLLDMCFARISPSLWLVFLFL